MSKLRMINDFVLVELLEAETVSTGGIIMSSVEPPCAGRVLSVGKGKYLPNGQLQEHDIVPDDIIIFGKSALNQPIEHEKVIYYVMKIEEVFGKKN